VSQCQPLMDGIFKSMLLLKKKKYAALKAGAYTHPLFSST